MNTRISIPSESCWRKWHIVSVFFLICIFMLRPAMTQHWDAAYSFYGRIFVLSVIGLYLFMRRFDNPVEVNLVLAYAVWAIICRFCRLDFFLYYDTNVIIGRFLCVAVIGAGPLMDARQRKTFLRWLCAVFCAYHVVVAVLAIAANVLGTQIFIPPEAVFGHSSYDANTLNYIIPFGVYRNTTAMWFYIALFLAIYSVITRPHLLVRVLYGLAALVLYVAVVLTFCRSVMVATICTLAMLAVLFALKYIPCPKLWQKAAVVLLCLALVLPLSYKSFGWTSSAMSWLSSRILTEESASPASAPQGEAAPAGEAVSSEGSAAEVPVPAEEQSGVSLVDNRDILKDAATLTNRTKIYATLIPTMKEDPLRIFFGASFSDMMDIPHRLSGWRYYHMHDAWLQALMEFGVPGFLIMMAFCILLVVRMVIMFFSVDPRCGLAEKFLILPLTGFFIYSLIEICIFNPSGMFTDAVNVEIRELMFFLLSGFFLADSYSVLPSLRRNKLH